MNLHLDIGGWPFTYFLTKGYGLTLCIEWGLLQGCAVHTG